MPSANPIAWSNILPIGMGGGRLKLDPPIFRWNVVFNIINCVENSNSFYTYAPVLTSRVCLGICISYFLYSFNYCLPIACNENLEVTDFLQSKPKPAFFHALGLSKLQNTHVPTLEVIREKPINRAQVYFDICSLSADASKLLWWPGRICSAGIPQFRPFSLPVLEHNPAARCSCKDAFLQHTIEGGRMNGTTVLSTSLRLCSPPPRWWFFLEPPVTIISLSNHMNYFFPLYVKVGENFVSFFFKLWISYYPTFCGSTFLPFLWFVMQNFPFRSNP